MVPWRSIYCIDWHNVVPPGRWNQVMAGQDLFFFSKNNSKDWKICENLETHINRYLQDIIYMIIYLYAYIN